MRIIEVHATRGKHVRAEPISALYSIGRISHVGTFNKLEDQMCQMTVAGFEGQGSPDRVDAMVWAFTELFPALTADQVSRKRRFTTHNQPGLDGMKNEEILKIAKEQFEESDAVSNFNRENYKDDVRFARMSEQWDEDIKTQRWQRVGLA